MKVSLKKGFSYGLTSGVITTLGLFMGLFSGTGSKGVILAGIFTIAFADALSDGLGIHISEESENNHTKKEIWEATLATLFSKIILALTFVIPVLVFPLPLAALVSVFWGVAVLAYLSYKIAISNNEKAWRVMGEHLFIALLVIIVSYFIGDFINSNFTP